MDARMGGDSEPAAIFGRSAVKLEGTVKRVMASFVSVDLPAGWAPASFSLPPGTVEVGTKVGVAGEEDSSLASEKRRGLRVLALRLGSEAAPSYVAVHHSEGSGDGPAVPAPPKKGETDFSDL
jgi:hypothetical protein